MWYVEVRRDNRWSLVGVYETERQATLIAKSYRAQGEKARVVQDEK